MKNLVFDIGGTSIKYGVCQDNQLTGTEEVPTLAEKGGAHILETVISLIQTHSDYDAIGISTAGQVHAKDGYIIYANQNIPGYTGIQFKKNLEELFHVPVAVENDVNAAALGEAVYGAGQNYDQFLMLTYGTGVGGAVINDRKVFHGSSYSASEFGAIITHSDARLSGGDFFDGCYEKYASTTGLLQMIKPYRPELDTGRKIFDALGDDKVVAIIDKWVDEIMLGLATLTHIYNPSCILLGGGIMSQPLILQKIGEKKSRFIMPSFSHVHIAAAALGNSAGMWGANYLASQSAT
ncbi:MAG: ROK family protein [Lachnospiraceae bacterium]|nr:ROK family protein [Lachnospiraceae bacterium]